MAKKTTAKKTTAKKPKRRLRRTARRSLAAVLMITAVVVAAIPVPENAAADPAGRAARAGDVHDSAIESSFGYDATNQEINNIQTATWANKNLNKFVKQENGESVLDEDAILAAYTTPRERGYAGVCFADGEGYRRQ